MSVIATIASCFTPYLTIDGLVPGQTYGYAKRDKKGAAPVRYPVVHCTMHRPKYHAHPIVYMAVRAGVAPAHLAAGDKLYIGSQSGPDRMFRGDGLAKALNFHHAQMRTGRDGQNLVQYLQTGGALNIYLAEGPALRLAAKAFPSLAPLSRLLEGELVLTDKAARKYKDHVGYWFEQLILRDEHNEWAWNSHGADAPAVAALQLAGV